MPIIESRLPRRALPALLSLAVLSGCASLAPERGLDALRAETRPFLTQTLIPAHTDEQRADIQARVDTLLAQPLDADAAVQLALLNNPSVQAAFQSLALADAERVAAGRLPNPGLTIGRLVRGGEIEWERSLHLDLARLLALPLTTRIGARQFEQTRRAVALEILTLADATRRAWIDAVAAAQSLSYQRQALDAAEASATLAQRMRAVGNWSALKQAREQAFYADTALAAAQAELASTQARERLVRRLGLADGSRVRLPERLPDLPATLPALPDAEQQALDSRIDLQTLRFEVDTLAANLGLARRTRLINVLEPGALDVGVINNGSNTEPQQRGYEISFELPLFDFGQTRIANAEARYLRALETARGAAIDARSEVREAYAARAGQFAVARHFADEIVPLKKRISNETLLRYNGMLSSVFELLADARSQIAAVNAALAAQRDFWLADASFQMARAGKPASRPLEPVRAAQDETSGGH